MIGRGCFSITANRLGMFSPFWGCIYKKTICKNAPWRLPRGFRLKLSLYEALLSQ